LKKFASSLKIDLWKSVKFKKFLIIALFLTLNLSSLLIYNYFQVNHIVQTISNENTVDEVFLIDNFTYSLDEVYEIQPKLDPDLIKNSDFLPFFDVLQNNATLNSSKFNARNLRIISLPQNFSTYISQHSDLFNGSILPQNIQNFNMSGIYIDYDQISYHSTFHIPTGEFHINLDPHSSLGPNSIISDTLNFNITNLLFYVNPSQFLSNLFLGNPSDTLTHFWSNPQIKNYSLLFLDPTVFREIFQSYASSFPGMYFIKFNSQEVQIEDWNVLKEFFINPKFFLAGNELPARTIWNDGVFSKIDVEFQIISLKNLFTLLLMILINASIFIIVLRDFFKKQYQNNTKTFKKLLIFGEDLSYNKKSFSNSFFQLEMRQVFTQCLLTLGFHSILTVVVFRGDLQQNWWFSQKLILISSVFYILYLILFQSAFRSRLQFHFSEKIFHDSLLQQSERTRAIKIGGLVVGLILLGIPTFYLGNDQNFDILFHPGIFFFVQILQPISLCLFFPILFYELIGNLFLKKCEILSISLLSKIFFSPQEFQTLKNSLGTQRSNFSRSSHFHHIFSVVLTFTLLNIWTNSLLGLNLDNEVIIYLKSHLNSRQILVYLIPLQILCIVLFILSEFEYVQRKRQQRREELERLFVVFGNTGPKFHHYLNVVSAFDEFFLILFHMGLSLLSSVIIFRLYVFPLFSVFIRI